MSKDNRTKTRMTRRTRKRKNTSSRHGTQRATRTRSDRKNPAQHSRNGHKRSRLEPEPIVISDSDASEKSEKLDAQSTSHQEVSVMTAYQSSTSESGYDLNTSQDTLFGIPDIGHLSDAHFSDAELFKAWEDDDDWFGWADHVPSRVPVLHMNDVLSRVESPDTEEEEEDEVEESEGRVRARWQCLRAAEQCTVAAVAGALLVQRMPEEQRQDKHRFCMTPPAGKSLSVSVAHASRGGKATPMVSVNGRRVRLSAETIRDGDALGEGEQRVRVRHKNTVYQMQVIEEM